MSFKDFDYLSPKISLFSFGRHRHSSDFGAFLTIIMLFFCFTFIFYSFSDVYLHTSSTIQYYRHFFKEKENFKFNNTEGIFHFFQMYNLNNHEIALIDLRYVRFFLSYIQDEYRRNPKMLYDNDHWVYDRCRIGIDNQFISKDLFKNISFEYGLCIRYYYNSNDKKYYSVDYTEKFIYPNINSSDMSMDYSIGTVIERCNNDSVLTKLLGKCGDEKEIDNYIKNYGFNIDILTNEISPGNYTNQINKYFFGISSSMKRNKYIVNNIALSPLKVDMRKGIVFPSRCLNKTYTYDGNHIMEEDQREGSRVLSIYNFYLSKSGYVYKSSYLTIYDSFHKIGGIVQLIYYIFFCLNFIYNRFIIINDTKKLFFSEEKKEITKGVTNIQNFTNIVKNLRKKYQKTTIKRKSIKQNFNIHKKEKIIEIKNNNNNNLENKHFSNNNVNESFFQRYLENDNNRSLAIFPFISDKDLMNHLNNSNKKFCSINSEIIHNKHKEEDLNYKNIVKEDHINTNSEKKNRNNEYINNDDNQNKCENIQINVLNNNNENFSVNYSNNNSIDNDAFFMKILLNKYFSYKRQQLLFEKIYEIDISKLFKFRRYIYTLFCYTKKRSYYIILKKFRKKVISEEHLFKAHNSLYIFEQFFDLHEHQKIDIIELYKNL